MRLRHKNNQAYLYGTIWEGDGTYIVSKLDELTEPLDAIHIHTYGGSVFDGNLIFNKLKELDVDIYIDGVAASMGSILMLAGKETYMSKNAYIMIHKPTTGVWGTAQDLRNQADLLEEMEKNFVSEYAERTGKKKEEAVEFMNQGDKWFSATQAKEAGLIDGIVGESEIEETYEDYKEGFTQMVAAFTQPNSKREQSIKNNVMDNKKLVESLGLEGVDENSSDTAIIEAVLAQQKSATRRAETAETKLADHQKKEQDRKEAKISAMVTEAIGQGIVKAEQRELYETIGKTNGEANLSEVLAGMKKSQPSLQSSITNSVEDTYSWDEWQEKNPRGLEKMQAENPAKYQKLYNQKFGN